MPEAVAIFSTQFGFYVQKCLEPLFDPMMRSTSNLGSLGHILVDLALHRGKEVVTSQVRVSTTLGVKC